MKNKMVLFVLCCVLAESAWSDNPSRIDLFTDSDNPFTNLEAAAPEIRIQIFDLDAPQRLLQQLSQDLPTDPAEAAVIARQRLHSLGHEQLHRQFSSAFAGLLRALEYNIDRYPAIVFDGGSSVIYGVSDFRQALKVYRRWRQSQKR